MDSAVQILNNWGQICSQNWAITFHHITENFSIILSNYGINNLICIGPLRELACTLQFTLANSGLINWVYTALFSLLADVSKQRK